LLAFLLALLLALRAAEIVRQENPNQQISR